MVYTAPGKNATVGSTAKHSVDVTLARQIRLPVILEN